MFSIITSFISWLFSGYYLVTDLNAVKLYSDSANYVFSVDLAAGATIQLFNEKHVTDWGINEVDDYGNLGKYGTNKSPRITPSDITIHWQDLFDKYQDKAFAVINAQFFGSKPLQLAFPIKENDVIITGGYSGEDEFYNQKMMFTIDDIKPFNEDGLALKTEKSLLVGLNENADKGAINKVGRTFIGINGQTATQKEASDTLRMFGAEKVMMLDGGGSAQSIAQGKLLVKSSDPTPRKIPHVIGIILP